MRNFRYVIIFLTVVFAVTVSYASLVLSEPINSKRQNVTSDFCNPLRVKIGEKIFILPKEINIIYMRNGDKKPVNCHFSSGAQIEVTEIYFLVPLPYAEREVWYKNWPPQVEVRIGIAGSDTFENAIREGKIKKTEKITNFPKVGAFYKKRYYSLYSFLLISADPKFKTASGRPVTFDCIPQRMKNEVENNTCSTEELREEDLAFSIRQFQTMHVPLSEFQVFYKTVMKKTLSFQVATDAATNER